MKNGFLLRMRLSAGLNSIHGCRKGTRNLGACGALETDAIIHFGEQRAAPHSMIDDKHRRYSVDNNVVSTHNICSAIVDINKEIHLVHLELWVCTDIPLNTEKFLKDI